MATTNVLIKNNSGGHARIILFHKYSGGDTKFETFQTRGDARAYIASAMEKVKAAKEQNKLAGIRQ